MSLRNGQKVSRKATRAAQDAVRRAAQSALGAPTTSRWENLENRVLFAIAQVDPTYVVFEAEHADAVMTDGIGTAATGDVSRWVRVAGSGAAGNVSNPSGGTAIVAIGQSPNVGGERNTGSVSYPINFTTAGTYKLYTRVKYNGGGDNSMWAPAPGGAITGDPALAPNPAYDNRSDSIGDYHWNTAGSSANPPVAFTYTVDAGEQTLKFNIREQGYFVDKVVLSTNHNLTEAELNALAGVPANVTAGGATAHYYNDNFWGAGGASGGGSGRPASPSATDPFPSQTIKVGRPGDVVTTVQRIAFDWGGNSPDPAIRPDDHSTVFVGKVTAPETGDYLFLGRGDDDTHVFVNGMLVSSNPGGHGIEDPRGQGSIDRGGGARTVHLEAGQQYDFVVLQAEQGGGSGVFLDWITPSMRDALGDASPSVTIPSQFLSPVENAPDAPTGVTRDVTAPDGQVAFTFTDNSTEELHYELQRSTDGGTSWVRVGVAHPIVNNDQGAAAESRVVGPAPLPGTTALYRVAAWNYAGVGTASGGAAITSPAAADGPGVSVYAFNDQWWKGYAPGAGPDRSDTGGGRDIIVGYNPDAYAVLPNVNDDWVEGSPAPDTVQIDNHSTAHQGKLHIETAGDYQIMPFGDDDVYVWIGNQLVGGDPNGHGVPGGVGEIPIRNTIHLEPGDYNLTAVQSEGGWGSAIHLRWVEPGGDPAAPTDIPDAAYVSSLPDVPAAPTGLALVSDDPTQMKVTFTDNSLSELRYVVERAVETAPGSGVAGAYTTRLFPIIAQNTNPSGAPNAGVSYSFIDTGLAPDTRYFYRIRAENFRGVSATAEANGKTIATVQPPLAPSLLSAWGLGGRNQLNFTDNSPNETGFVIERKVNGAAESTWAAIATRPGSAAGATGAFTLIDNGVDANVLYDYRVRATNDAGQSDPSNVATARQVGYNATIFGTRFLQDNQGNPNDPLVRADPMIDFNFDALPGGGPDPLIAGDNFSIRWESVFTPKVTGSYVFHGISDDGIRVYLDGELIVDAWVDRGRTDTASAAVSLDANTDHTLVVEYYENGGGANATVDVEVTADGATTRHVIGPDELSREKKPALVAPASVTATNPLADCVVVSWADVNNVSETGYEVQRSTSPDGGFTTVLTTGPNVFRVLDMSQKADGATYYYRVRALGAPAASAYSAASDGVTPGAAPATTPINLPNFGTAETQAMWTLNNAATWRDADGDPEGTTERLMLTVNQNDQIGSAYLNEPRAVDHFKAEFDFQVTNSNGADGFTFILQANDTGAIGGGGGALGWVGINNSFGVKYDFYPNPQTNQVGILFNGQGISDSGADPQNRNVPTAFDLDNGTMYHTSIAYDGTTKVLTVTLDDINNAATAPFVATWNNVDLPLGMNSGCAYVGFTGATGGLNARQEITSFSFTNDTVQPTRVSQVFVNGGGLTGNTSNANTLAFRAMAGIDGTYGYAIPAGANQTKSIPWNSGINQVALRFTQPPVGLEKDDLVIRGVNNASYATSAMTYDPATKTAVWTLSQAVTNDKLRLFLDDARVANLDGDWTNPGPTRAYPSGDNTLGGDFDFRIHVLRGDATQDGRVSALDLSLVRQKLNRTATQPGTGGGAYTPFADINADGSINALDLSAVRQRLNNALPANDPVLASLFSSLPLSL